METQPKQEQVLKASQSVFRLARIWGSPEVAHYAVTAEARAEINEYLLDLIGRAYQLLSRYHSWKGRGAGSQREMENAYQQASSMIRQAVALKAEKFQDVGLVNQSASELLRMVLSYPEKFQKVGKGKNPISSRDAPGCEQDRRSYEDYLTTYPLLQERVESCRSHLKRTQSEFQRMTKELNKRIQSLDADKERALEKMEKERKQHIQKRDKTVALLPAMKSEAVNRATWAPVGIGLVSWVILALSNVTWLTALGVGLGSVALSYSHGFSKEVFHGEIPVWLNGLRWAGLIALFSGLAPLIGDWIAYGF